MSDSRHSMSSEKENSIASPLLPNRTERPSRAQAQIYGQIARGLTDVLMEFGLLGTADMPDPRLAASFQEMMPRELVDNVDNDKSKSLPRGSSVRKRCRTSQHTCRRQTNLDKEPAVKAGEVAHNAPSKKTAQNAGEAAGAQGQGGTTEAEKREHEGYARAQTPTRRQLYQ